MKLAKFSGMAVGPEGRLWYSNIVSPTHYDGLASIGPGGKKSRPICVEFGRYCSLESRQLATGPGGVLWYLAGPSASYGTGGGGGSGLLEEESLNKSPGYIGRVR